MSSSASKVRNDALLRSAASGSRPARLTAWGGRPPYWQMRDVPFQRSSNPTGMFIFSETIRELRSPRSAASKVPLLAGAIRRKPSEAEAPASHRHHDEIKVPGSCGPRPWLRRPARLGRSGTPMQRQNSGSEYRIEGETATECRLGQTHSVGRAETRVPILFSWPAAARD
jgi:hypothetical protein